MKFGVLYEIALPRQVEAGGKTEYDAYWEAIEQIKLAEALGFHSVWAVEHHSLKWYAHMSAPEIFLTWVAARTSRIRIGHGVVCLPFNYNHPLRVAERAAMLDTLSIERAAILGFSSGGPSAVHFAARHPGRITALLLDTAILLPFDPVTTAFESKPRRVSNIFICSWVVFCASSRITNESLSVRPRMKARGATSMMPRSINRLDFSKGIISFSAS